MQSATENTDVVEVTTELTISDVQHIEHVLNMCLQLNIFSEESKVVIENLCKKINVLSTDLASKM